MRIEARNEARNVDELREMVKGFEKVLEETLPETCKKQITDALDFIFAVEEETAQNDFEYALNYNIAGSRGAGYHFSGSINVRRRNEPGIDGGYFSRSYDFQNFYNPLNIENDSPKPVEIRVRAYTPDFESFQNNAKAFQAIKKLMDQSDFPKKVDFTQDLLGNDWSRFIKGATPKRAIDSKFVAQNFEETFIRYEAPRKGVLSVKTVFRPGIYAPEHKTYTIASLSYFPVARQKALLLHLPFVKRMLEVDKNFLSKIDPRSTLNVFVGEPQHLTSLGRMQGFDMFFLPFDRGGSQIMFLRILGEALEMKRAKERSLFRNEEIIEQIADIASKPEVSKIIVSEQDFEKIPLAKMLESRNALDKVVFSNPEIDTLPYYFQEFLKLSAYNIKIGTQVGLEPDKLEQRQKVLFEEVKEKWFNVVNPLFRTEASEYEIDLDR